MTENRENLQHEAERMGLTNLSAKHLDQLAKAKAAAERMVQNIPRHLHMYDEPAHIFQASKEA